VSAILKDLIAAFQRDLYKPEREHLRRAELEAMTFYNRIRKEAAEEIRNGGVRYDLRAFNVARVIGPGRTLEFVQSAVADYLDPESDRE
jgi:hypothetical protein